VRLVLVQLAVVPYALRAFFQPPAGFPGAGGRALAPFEDGLEAEVLGKQQAGGPEGLQEALFGVVGQGRRSVEQGLEFFPPGAPGAGVGVHGAVLFAFAASLAHGLHDEPGIQPLPCQERAPRLGEVEYGFGEGIAFPGAASPAPSGNPCLPVGQWPLAPLLL
jgi:hypothetical protein